MDRPECIREGVPLSELTSIRLGGPAQFLAEPRSVDEVEAVLAWARARGLPIRVLGGGTNLLVDDRGVEGVVIHMRAPGLAGVRVLADDGEVCRLIAGAAAPLARLSAMAREFALQGLEPLAGVPGSVGGAVKGNAGTADGEIGHVATAVTVLDPTGRIRRVEPPELRFSYRRSSLNGSVILEAELRLTRGDAAAIDERVQGHLRRRRETQPLDGHSAGCIFRNPPGDHAGRLIDAAGLKGAQSGDLLVSDRHANFFLNVGRATWDDARRLIDRVRDAVRRRFGIELELEVEVWQDRGPQGGALPHS